MSVSKLCEQLVSSGHQVTVFTTTANGPTELPVQENEPVDISGVPVYYFRRITKDHSHFSPALLRAVWQQVRNFQAVHIHAWWNMVSVLSALLAVMRGVPVIISPRGTLSRYSFGNKNAFFKTCIHGLLGKHLLKRSSVHATSVHEKNDLQQIIAYRQIFNIPNFIELPLNIPAKKNDADGILRLIFFSRIEEKKGLETLLNALVRVTVPYKLTIAGSGALLYIDSLKQLAARNNLEANIDWIGFQGENKFDILAQHHLMVLPSYDENFGNVVIESLGAGTAVLVSRQVGLAGYIAENNLGWICDTDAGSVADVLNSIDRKRLTEIAGSAPAIIRRDFDADALIQQYINMYQQVIQHG